MKDFACSKKKIYSKNIINANGISQTFMLQNLKVFKVIHFINIFIRIWHHKFVLKDTECKFCKMQNLLLFVLVFLEQIRQWGKQRMFNEARIWVSCYKRIIILTRVHISHIDIIYNSHAITYVVWGLQARWKCFCRCAHQV